MERRTKEIYLAHCAELGGPLHDHIATTYGVAGNSILNDLDFFHVTTGLVPDIMHNILEGMSGPAPSSTATTSISSTPAQSSAGEAGKSHATGKTRKDVAHERKKGKKRQRSDDTEALALVMERMEEHAAEREERIRKLELEMEERRAEREDKREDRIFSMFAAMFQNMGNRPPYQPQLFAYQNPPYQQPHSPSHGTSQPHHEDFYTEDDQEYQFSFSPISSSPTSHHSSLFDI